jgi:competence protein ComEA
MKPVEITRLPEHRFDYRLDINTATWVEWMQLENIGEVTARRIVADREQNGPFPSIESLERVPGIGPKTLESMRPWLLCPGCQSNPVP